MAKLKVGINGFGRIGRNVYKAAFDNDNIEVVAVNDLTDNNTLAHLLKYDSVFGIWDKKIEASGDKITVDGKDLIVTSTRNIEELK